MITSCELIVGKKTLLSGESEIFPRWGEEILLEKIRVWKSVFPQEKNWIWQNLSVPSLILRVDCVIDPHAQRVGIYEIEDRPAGIGSTSKINCHFSTALNMVRRGWPSFSIVCSDSRRLDDHLWVDEKDLRDVKTDELVFPRFEPEETRFHVLQSRSVAPLLEEGNKSYGLSLGLWSSVSREEHLPRDRSFVLKPLVGTRCKGLVICSHLPSSKRPQGAVSRDRAVKELAQSGGMFLQEVIPPMRATSVVDHDMIYRLYFGYSIMDREYVALGGVWNSRPRGHNGNYKIHGASDSVFGPLILE